jgi:UDP-N-acetylmuramyl pentapeptide phosphotransferase/UDP-N-acetylglucosamine-1-phosphate transferase
MMRFDMASPKPGLDWMTVVEVVPITAALAAIGLLGYIPWQDTVISLALCGATIGFAFFNRLVAKLFLGDVGSLPIGLLLGWLLLLLARQQWPHRRDTVALILSCRQHCYASDSLSG